MSYIIFLSRLKIKNQYLLTKLEQNLTSAYNIDPTLSFLEQSQQTDDSLSRINQTIKTLIDEAKQNLNTRLSFYADPRPRHSFSQLTRKSATNFRSTKRRKRLRRKSAAKNNNLLLLYDLLLDCHGDTDDKILSAKALTTVRNQYYRRWQLSQQNRRYFYSLWNLTLAMNQLMETVKLIAKERHRKNDNEEVNSAATFTTITTNAHTRKCYFERRIHHDSTLLCYGQPDYSPTSSSFVSLLFKYAFETIDIQYGLHDRHN
ncbi:MAG: hypothetical protein EXX96DRAFT_619137 [Benjaminiella poitrasii]|nr:MAG: hypothetical protein EXX96DRAFT_619137 [Benjaminiella poitrasii]